MKGINKSVAMSVAVSVFSLGCSSGGGSTAPGRPGPEGQSTGSISISLTDGPWEDARAMVLRITGIEIGRDNGIESGSYRIAFSCSGEWDEQADDDYPADPDGRFDFQIFSNPVNVTAGQMHGFDLMP